MSWTESCRGPTDALIDNFRRLVAGKIIRMTCGSVVMENDAWWAAKLSAGAARQLVGEISRMRDEIETFKAADRVHLSAHQGEVDRLRSEIASLRAAIKGAEIALARDEDSAAAPQILIKAQEEK
jgi:hypothetical protein